MCFVRNVSGSNSVLPKMYLSSVPWRVSLVMYYIVLFSLLYHPVYLFNFCKTEDVLSYKTTLLLLHLVLPLMASIRNVNKPPPPGVVKQRHVYGVLWRLIARDRVKLIPPPSNWGGCFLPYIKSCFPSRRQQFDSGWRQLPGEDPPRCNLNRNQFLSFVRGWRRTIGSARVWKPFNDLVDKWSTDPFQNQSIILKS